MWRYPGLIFVECGMSVRIVRNIRVLAESSNTSTFDLFCCHRFIRLLELRVQSIGMHPGCVCRVLRRLTFICCASTGDSATLRNCNVNHKTTMIALRQTCSTPSERNQIVSPPGVYPLLYYPVHGHYLQEVLVCFKQLPAQRCAHERGHGPKGSLPQPAARRLLLICLGRPAQRCILPPRAPLMMQHLAA